MTTAITGSYPRPLWYDVNLRGQSFKAALGDSLFREQYLDAVAAVINAQESAGLDDRWAEGVGAFWMSRPGKISSRWLCEPTSDPVAKYVTRSPIG